MSSSVEILFENFFLQISPFHPILSWLVQKKLKTISLYMAAIFLWWKTIFFCRSRHFIQFRVDWWKTNWNTISIHLRVIWLPFCTAKHNFKKCCLPSKKNGCHIKGNFVQAFFSRQSTRNWMKWQDLPKKIQNMLSSIKEKCPSYKGKLTNQLRIGWNGKTCGKKNKKKYFLLSKKNGHRIWAAKKARYRFWLMPNIFC